MLAMAAEATWIGCYSGGGGGGGPDFATLCASIVSTQSQLSQTCLRTNPALPTTWPTICLGLETEITAGRVNYNRTRERSATPMFRRSPAPR